MTQQIRPRDTDIGVRSHISQPTSGWHIGKLRYNIARLSGPLLAKRLPPLFGDDMAGIIVAKGRNVSGFEVGDAVYGMDMRLRTASLAERARISRKRIARKPESLSFGEAGG